MVEGAPCELEPPTLDWINVSVQAKPNGARYMPTQDVRVKGKDNVGVTAWYLLPSLRLQRFWLGRMDGFFNVFFVLCQLSRFIAIHLYFQ